MSFDNSWDKKDTIILPDENNWEEDFLDIITKRVQETIEQIANESGIDLAFYKFKLTVDIMSNDFYTKLKEKVLINSDQTFCSFCHTPTNLYIESKDLFLCPKCYKESM